MILAVLCELYAEQKWPKVKGRIKGRARYLLSDQVNVVTSLNFEGAVVCPQVDRVWYACDAALVDLVATLAGRFWYRCHGTDRFCSFCASNEELFVRVALPVYEE